MQSERRKLENRRLNVTTGLKTESGKYHVSFGVEPETGRIGEVFIRGSKSGSDMDILLDDASVVLSLALQYGLPLEQLLHSLHTGREEGGTSIIAKVIAVMNEEIDKIKAEVPNRSPPPSQDVPEQDSSPEEGEGSLQEK